MDEADVLAAKILHEQLVVLEAKLAEIQNRCSHTGLWEQVDASREPSYYKIFECPVCFKKMTGQKLAGMRGFRFNS